MDLADGLQISRPAVSRHLRLLAEAGLVAVEVRGRERHDALDRRRTAPHRGDSMSPQPTGRIETTDGVRRLVIDREFRAPIDDVWAAVTESERLASWIGVWTGDPASGHVQFAMTAESEDATADDMEIRECTPPTRLAVTSQVGDERWQLELDLVERDGVTVVTFTQPDIDPAIAESVGPGWEYYLDRLGAVLTGGDVAAVDFDRDYYPAMAEHYRMS